MRLLSAQAFPFEQAGYRLQEQVCGNEDDRIGQQDRNPREGYGDTIQVIHVYVQSD